MKSNRLILWLALGGMVLAVHLWIQKARGFDQGCLGLATPTTTVAAGCHAADLLPASHLLGISNAAWGFAFYFGIALLSLAKIVAPPAWAHRAHLMSEIGICGGTLYSGYLVLTMVQAGAVCVLCLVSATLVLALFGLIAWMRVKGRFQPISDSARVVEFGFAGLGVFAAGGMLLGVLLFVNRLGTRPLGQGAGARELEDAVVAALEFQFDHAKLAELRACRFDDQAPALDLAKFIGPTTPFIGKPDGVPVIVFSDPTCEACKLYHAEFLRAAEQLGDRARFTLLPRVFREESVLEASALKIAEGTGKYFALWQALYDRQPRADRGMTLTEVTTIFREIGIDTTELERRLNAARPAVLATREHARASEIDLVPAVYIGGRKVWLHSRSVECLSQLIDHTSTLASDPPVRRRAR